MFSFLFKSMFHFVLAFLILSFPINGKTIFSYLGQFTLPYTQKVYETCGEYFKETISKGKRFGKKLFSNSVPQNIPQAQVEGNYLSTSPKFLFSSINKKKFVNSEENNHKNTMPMEDHYSQSDTNKLKSLIQ